MLTLQMFTILGRQFGIVFDTQEAIFANFGDPQDIVDRFGEPDVTAEPASNEADDIISAYNQGQLDAFRSFRRSQTGTPFQTAVWNAISTIEGGATMTYSELADSAGHPTAVRAAASACGANTLPILIPCHRIVKRNGETGKYGPGPEIKVELLSHEGSLPSY